MFTTDMSLGDLDGDGDTDVALPFAGDDMIGWLPNDGGQFSLATIDTSPGGILAGEADDVLEIEAAHLGRSADSMAELATLELLFEETAADPLSTPEASALVTSVDVYLDDGSGDFDIADSLVATTGTPSLSSGVQTVPLTEGAPDVQLDVGSPRTYFVVLDLTAGAAAAAPNSFIVTHLTETSSTAEDAPNDIPLQMEFFGNVTTATVTVQGSCNALTLSSSSGGADPVADPATSTGCPAGEYVAGETISLTATPDPSFVVVAWTGTDDDPSTALVNVLTMPNGAAAVSVSYAVPDIVIIEAPVAINDEIFEACEAIKVGDTDGVGFGVVQLNENGSATFRATDTVEFFNEVRILGELAVDLAKPVGCP